MGTQEHDLSVDVVDAHLVLDGESLNGHALHGHARARGAHTQSRILETAVQIASVEGLDAMSLATLAGATRMSKSGLFAHFRSKEALQLAIIDEAERLFALSVTHMADGKTGLARLQALVEAYVDYTSGQVFQGGCFFAATVHEFDARPGPLRDRLGQWLDRWNDALRAALGEAKKAGEIGDVDVEQVVFEISGLGLATNWHAQMRNREQARTMGAASARNLLARLITSR